MNISLSVIWKSEYIILKYKDNIEKIFNMSR